MRRHDRTRIVNVATVLKFKLQFLRNLFNSDSAVKFKLEIAVDYTVSGEIYTTNPKG